MNSDFSYLQDSSMQLVFVNAPTGLGHLRVTDALQHALPENTKSITLGEEDPTISSLYRFISIHSVARFFYEWLQDGLTERPFTAVYRKILRSRTRELYEDIKKIAENKKIKRLLVVATHFGLAHKLGEIKEKIQNDFGVRVILVQTVTDDSPQKIWYVKEADLICVPSDYTKTNLLWYAQQAGFPKVDIRVCPYPVSPLLSESLGEDRYELRKKQTNPKMDIDIEVAIPISGAAVGMDFFSQLIQNLHEKDSRFAFHIICKRAPYTLFFLYKAAEFEKVDLHESASDQTLLDIYENLYQKETIAIEITKPSEQAFKALLQPEQVGGSILLFTRPLGRQEYDNINFLRRHMLIPTKEEQYFLFDLAKKGRSLKADEYGQTLFNKSIRWRGLRLPKKPAASVQFIEWCLQQGFFAQMMTCCAIPNQDDLHHEEVNPHGVDKFWKFVKEVVETRFK